MSTEKETALSGCCGGHSGAGPTKDAIPQPRTCCAGHTGHASANIATAQPATLQPGVPLLDMEPGQTATVRGTSMDPAEARLLRAMGLRPNCVVRMCRVGEPCIVEVMFGCAEGGKCSCRIGLSRPLAERVLVGDVTHG